MIKKTIAEALNRYVFKVVKETVSGGDEICRLEKFDATEAPTRKLWIPRCIKGRPEARERPETVSTYVVCLRQVEFFTSLDCFKPAV